MFKVLQEKRLFALKYFSKGSTKEIEVVKYLADCPHVVQYVDRYILANFLEFCTIKIFFSDIATKLLVIELGEKSLADAVEQADYMGLNFSEMRDMMRTAMMEIHEKGTL